MTPGKLHLALNHFVFLFPLAALIPLGVGLLMKSRPAILSGIGIALIGRLLTGIVMGTGEEAYERYKSGPIAAHLDAGAGAALDHHEEVGHTWSKVMYAMAGASIAAFVVAFTKHRWLPWAAVAVMALCLASAVAGIAIADTGSEIRRPDFRSESASER